MHDHSSLVKPAMVPSESSPASRASSARRSASVRVGEGGGGVSTAAGRSGKLVRLVRLLETAR